MVKGPGHNTGTKTSCRIEGASSVEDANHLSNEESKSNADWCNESSFMLLLGKHENSEDEFSCQECLDENSLRYTGTAGESGPDIEFGWKKPKNYPRSSNGASYLCKKNTDCSDDWERTDEHHSERHGGVEQASRDTEEYPYIHHQRETEGE